MNITTRTNTGVPSGLFTKNLLLASLASVTIGASNVTLAQEDAERVIEEVVITGIRSSLQSALNEKRGADSLIEVIIAEDIGKLPDQNLAEVLENITGVQITRTAGVGTGVQIRGTDDNRVEINGVSTVGAGGGRGGISFEDVNAAIIAAVEVTKAPEAKTIEGSVGGTINLRTIRPLELTERLASVRIQGEESDLSDTGMSPRFSGTFGDNWTTDAGDFGFVISGSYTEQESASFRPRLDRDGSLVENTSVNIVDGAREDAVDRPAAQAFDFLGIQFLNQELENFEYETTNIAASFEFAPNENLKFFADVIINEQERRQDSTRVQASGVSSVLNQNLPTEFETVNFGSLGGQDLGSIQAAVVGTIQPNLAVDDDDPNLRFNSDTGARITDSSLFTIGADWNADRWSGRVEVSNSESDSVRPTLSTQLNFINPNALTPLDGDVLGFNTSNDNSVPFIYDLRGNALTFGIDFASPFAPTVAQLTDTSGANIVLDQVDVSADVNDNSEFAFRADFSYDLDWGAIKSIDFGYRFNETESTFIDIGDRIGGFSRIGDSVRGTFFSDLLVNGPTNFGDADGRELAFRNFVIVDPDRAFNDQAGTLGALEAALEEHDALLIATNGQAAFDDHIIDRFLDDATPADGIAFSREEIDAAALARRTADLTPDVTAFFDIKEETTALYAQANFEYGIVRGNFGLRYIDTSVDSTGNTRLDNVDQLVTSSGGYSFILPRLNLVIEPSEDVLIRLGWGEDIGRADFSDLNTSVSFQPNENASVDIGNPGLEPQEVESFDISVDWYFAPSAAVSLGYFNKKRTNLFGTITGSAAVLPASDPGVNSDRETDPSCPGGGIFNPIATTNSFGPINTTGICVDFEQQVNDTGEITQKGIEFALQYDLSEFEDTLGFASGFGAIFNYTIQENSGGDLEFSSASRGTDVFNAINGIYDSANFVRVTDQQGLQDFSETAYNFTLYYEKHGLSARMRYTWREAFRTQDTAAGASLNSTLGFPVVTSDRGQLNASVNYDVTDNLNVGLEAVNLNNAGITQFCVNDGALLCGQGLPDRRITVGASYSF